MKKRALVLIGHGSRQPYNIEVVGEIAGKIRAREAWGVVSYCFNEMNEPSVADALDDICKDDEVTTIVFAPVFISSGRHVIEDIPRALGLPKGSKSKELEINGIQRRIMLMGPIGADDAIADLIDRNARALLGM